MTTVAQVINATIRQHLEMGGPSQVNRLQTAINPTVETLTLDWESDPGLAPGTFIEIDSEVMMVLQSQDTYVEMLRGQWGTAAVAHAAAALIRVQPRFLRSQVHTEMIDEVRSWPTGLFGVTTTTVSWPSGSHDVDLDGAVGLNLIRVLSIKQPPRGSEPWYDIETSVSVHPADTAVFPSGYRLHALRTGTASDVEVTFAHEFDLTEMEDESVDLVDDCGMSSSMVDIIRYGVAGRLLISQESERARIDVQGQTRFAEEVPPQHQMTAAQGLLDFHDKRVQQEEERLISRWGV